MGTAPTKSESATPPTSGDGNGTRTTEQKKVLERRTYSNGDVYEGTLVNDVRQGLGTYWTASQTQGNLETCERYEGMWVNNQRHGLGVLIIPQTGKHYEGQFENDRLHGIGYMHDKDLSYPIECRFHEGDVIEVKSTNKEGLRFVAPVKKGKLNGTVKYIYPNGNQIDFTVTPLQDNAYSVTCSQASMGVLTATLQRCLDSLNPAFMFNGPFSLTTPEGMRADSTFINNNINGIIAISDPTKTGSQSINLLIENNQVQSAKMGDYEISIEGLAGLGTDQLPGILNLCAVELSKACEHLLKTGLI